MALASGIVDGFVPVLNAGWVTGVGRVAVAVVRSLMSRTYRN